MFTHRNEINSLRDSKVKSKRFISSDKFKVDHINFDERKLYNLQTKN